jgi:hypothetical protein
VYAIVDRFAALGKDIKITEHDINITQRNVQADYTRDFMTILFSHASVKSFMIWGFWQNSHWKPDAALFNADWTIRPHGEAWKDLVFNQWWTKKADKIADTSGKVSFEGFLGTYKYTIKSGGRISAGTFEMNNSNQSGTPNSVELKIENYTAGAVIPNQNPVRIYPNPFKGSFVVETSGINDHPVIAELFNAAGQRVVVWTMDNFSGKTSIRHETPGIYTLRISNQKEMKVFKIVGN